MAEVRMPKMGDGMEEGTIRRWIKQEGDSVLLEEAVAEIETDKANVEMTAEEAGTLTQIVVREGETVPVGAIIAYIGTNSDSTRERRAVVGETAKTPESEHASTPPASITPSSTFLHLSSGEGESPASERVKASGLARRMAREMGIDLAQIQGSGPGGRIVERDILAIRASRQAVSAVQAPATSSETIGKQVQNGHSLSIDSTSVGQDVELSKMRKAIARRTVQSKQTVPHFYLVMPVEMDRAMSLLSELNAEQESDRKITVNHLIIKACAVALTHFPDVNVSFTSDEKLHRYSAINIGFAVPTDQGLTMPVIMDCASKSLRRLSEDARLLIGKARDGSLTPQEMSGGTFSISNLGMLGIEEFAAIINPPESAILAVGAVAKEVVVAESGEFVARQRMRITLSCDHRTVDGLLGAQFLQELRRLLEKPFGLLT